MGYYLNRYWRALRQHGWWLSLSILPVVLYLVAAALHHDTFIVTQDYLYHGEVPVAATDHPVRTQPLTMLVDAPDQLFMDGFALNQLLRRLHLETAWADITEAELPRMVNASMHLERPSEDRISLYYRGMDGELGHRFVDYFNQRLLTRVADGVSRARSAGNLDPDWRFEKAGPVSLEAFGTPWNPQRLLPATLILLAGLLIIAVAIAVHEFADSSFRSARQVARYLETQVLGEIPDLKVLTRNLHLDG